MVITVIILLTLSTEIYLHAQRGQVSIIIVFRGGYDYYHLANGSHFNYKISLQQVGKSSQLTFELVLFPVCTGKFKYTT